jgi:hypothetical protein
MPETTLLLCRSLEERLQPAGEQTGVGSVGTFHSSSQSVDLIAFWRAFSSVSDYPQVLARVPSQEYVPIIEVPVYWRGA